MCYPWRNNVCCRFDIVVSFTSAFIPTNVYEKCRIKECDMHFTYINLLDWRNNLGVASCYWIRILYTHSWEYILLPQLESQIANDKIFINIFLWLGYFFPIAISAIIYIHQRRKDVDHNQSTKAYISTVALLRIFLFKPCLSFLYSTIVVIKVYGTSDWIGDKMTQLGMFLLLGILLLYLHF